MTELISTFIFLFAVIDPIGSVPVFIAVTNGLSEKQIKQSWKDDIEIFKSIRSKYLLYQ